MSNIIKHSLSALLLAGLIATSLWSQAAGKYPIVDTGQSTFYDNSIAISAPSVG